MKIRDLTDNADTTYRLIPSEDAVFYVFYFTFFLSLLFCCIYISPSVRIEFTWQRKTPDGWVNNLQQLFIALPRIHFFVFYNRAPGLIITYKTLDQLSCKFRIISEFSIIFDPVIEGADNTAFFESLLLEIQRSMDFYESQLGKGIVSNLYLSPDTSVTSQIGGYMSSQLGLNVAPLDISELGITLEDNAARCVTAIGAAMGPNPEQGVASAAH